ncbi:TPA: glycosyltransferase family 2 protein [Clostridium perfringens]
MESLKPLVSIVIPTFGRAELLERAIISVISQSYKNIEIIIVDDNEPNSLSRRETKVIVSKYLKKHNIKYIQLDRNYGGAIARNKGISQSNGNYICFLDDDDVYHEDKIKLQIEKFINSKEDLAVVGCFANIVDDNGIKWIEKNEFKGNAFKKQLSSNICTTSIAMIKKEYLIKINGFSNIPSSQEHMLFLKIFSINPNYDYVEKILVDIYHHDGPRISTNKNKPLGAIELHKYIMKYYKNLTVNEIKEIEKFQHINIAKSYLSINDKKNAKKYLKKFIKKYKVIDKDVVKIFVVSILGFENLDKFRKYFAKLRFK